VNGLESALADLATFLDESRVPYMVIGGYASLLWGRPRLTRDLDVTVSVPEPAWGEFIARVGERYVLRLTDALAFAHSTRVIPAATRSGVPVDLLLAGLPYEEEAIARSRPVEVAGVTVRVCAPEDLILHKLVSERPRDREDVEAVIVRQGGALDLGYIGPRLRELATTLERPDMLDLYRACLRRAGLAES
jgi:hypothetical protein